MSTMVRVADYIARFIAETGVKHVFLLPGGGAMHLVDAMGESPHLSVVACLHEQAAGIAAEAYARVHQSLGVAVVTTGPGSTNAITAVVGAWIESVPLLIISGQVKRVDMLRGAPLRQRGVQEVDIVRLVKSITKYAVTVEQPEDIRMVMEQACHIAREGRAGPVWVDVPLDVQGASVNVDTLPAWDHTALGNGRETVLSDRTIAAIHTLLAGADRPLILAGHGIRLSGAAAVFRAWVEELGVPVVSTWNARDLLPHEHPLSVGCPGVVALRAPNFAVQNCDVLISLGCRLDNIVTAFNLRGFARAAKKVVVDIDQHEIDKLHGDLVIAVCADARLFISRMRHACEKPSQPDWSGWQARCMDWKRRYTVNDGQPLPSTMAISHYQLVETLSDVLPEGMLIVTGSSGLAVEAFHSVFRNKPGQRVLLTAGLGAMGYGLPAAVGACFAHGGNPVVAVEGDGSLQLNMQELSTLRAHRLPICLLVLNNHGYASIRSTQRTFFNGRYVGTGPESGLFLPDLKKLAAAYDLPFTRMESLEELESGLKTVLAGDKPIVVEIVLRSDEDLSPKVAAMQQPDGSMVSMPLEDMRPLLPLDVLQQEMVVGVLDASKTATRDSGYRADRRPDVM